MHLKILVLTTLAALSLTTHAQFGAGGAGGGAAMGPQQSPFRGEMAKIFADTPEFTADIKIETQVPGAQSQISLPGTMAYLNGRTRFEVDATKMAGGGMPPGAAQQMKAMGMGEMVTISDPEKKESYIIYPGLKAYAVIPVEEEPDADGAKGSLKKTDLGKETINGHPATKQKVVLKDESGKDQEIFVWSATDLKGFPIKFQIPTEAGTNTVTFSNVKLGKPAESMFAPPSDFKRYTDMGAMMREEMMKKFAPGGGLQPPN